jgi:xanthine dehydrogenase YagS FAD-binding subunit
VPQAICGINSLQLQSQGTLGGELCQRPRCWYFRNGRGLLAGGGREVLEGDSRGHAVLGNSGPAKFVCGSRLAPALIALGARIRVIGPRPGDATVMALEELYRTPRHEGQRESVLAPNQWITHIVLPPADGRCNAAYEVRHGAGPDYPLAAAAAALRIHEGFVRDAKIVLGQVAPTPWVSRDAARVILGLPVDDATADAAGRAAVASATPLADNVYKVQLARVAVKRSILLAAGMETGGF